MFDSVAFLRALAIVEKIKRTNKIAGDAADTFKPDPGSCQNLSMADFGSRLKMYHRSLL